jgi:predicted nuclease of predicted toxin-antitoxin system
VKLLLDQNLSPRLVNRLVDLYPDSSHVYLIGLDTAPDLIIWEYARDNEFIIVTRACY